IDTTNAKLIEESLPNADFVFVETPSNPRCGIVDVEKAVALAKATGAMLVVDGTFATPCCQRPLDLGASLVVHSATKYLAGHSDVMCGAVLGSGDLIGRLKTTQIYTGAILDPSAAWLLLRGVRTLALRVEAQSQSALAIARFLDAHPKISAVHYPWL